MKYKVGDKVRVISIEKAKKLFEPMFVKVYDTFWGTEVTIQRIEDDRYYIKEDKMHFCLKDNMFEGLSETTCSSIQEMIQTNNENTRSQIIEENGQYVIYW